MKNARKKLIKREAPKFGVSKASIKPVKIINIMLGGRDEEDEVKFMDSMGNTYIVFCSRITEKTRDNNISKLSCKDVLKHINANLNSFDIYTSDGEYIK